VPRQLAWLAPRNGPCRSVALLGDFKPILDFGAAVDPDGSHDTSAVR
jgi:hypothetical protein